MTLRRPAAHLRRATARRRSGDESYGESLISEGNILTRVSQPPRTPRPQSAPEGGHLDGWVEHLPRDLLRVPLHNQVPVFNDRTVSMPGLATEPTGHPWTQLWIPSFSRDLSSCGSPSLCETSLGSQESFHMQIFPPPECRGSWERVHILQAPRKEQPEISHLFPVKSGWLPVQRRVMMVAGACNQNQFLDPSAGQVKLKQPITPTFQLNRATPKTEVDGEVDRSHSGPTWQTPDQGSSIIKQMPEKQRLPTDEKDRPVSWQALRGSWNINRVSSFLGGSQSIELPIGTDSDPNRKSPIMKTTSLEHLKHTPLHQTTSAEPCMPHTLLQGTNSTEAYKSNTPMHKTSNVWPIKATAPLCRTNYSSQPPHIHTRSTVTTLTPQTKAGFSYITISSRKVSRSASLPGSDTPSHPSLPQPHQSIQPNSKQVTVQRTDARVNVSDQKVMSSPVLSTQREGTPPCSHTLDTAVHRRKATIIKVTQHRESYSSAKVTSGTRHPECSHSYTEDVYKDSPWSLENHSQHTAAPSHHHLDSTERPHPNTATSDPEKNRGTLHRSTVSLSVGTPPATPAPTPSKDVGQRSDRPPRPPSCYGSGHTEPSKENVTEVAARMWSFGLPQETNLVNSSSSFISPGTVVKETGQLMADALKTNRGEAERLSPPENATRRVSHCLTLIQAPDPDSHQSPEEVLAFNAAAIIANIKLQRQLSKKKTPSGDSEKASTASPQRNTVTDGGKCLKPYLDQSPVQCHSLPPAAFVPLSLHPERSPKTLSLQEALQRSRPDFISRSQARVRELERKAQERREMANSLYPQSNAAVRQKRAHSARSTSLKDNLLKPRDRAITVKDMQLPSKRSIY
uniref:(E2-independent) E3 ubiquitin-conjugating enzyme FATS isoform X2 n=1 Tax=Monopterus albus TaxID=43700 RepID=UPI0009B3E71E|nr:uncharacterized protein LOC109962936 isoform X2 [Monopterus albus]